MARVHPAKLVLITETKENIWRHQNSWNNPSKNSKPPYPRLFLYESLYQDHPEVDALAEHPEVCGQHEVGGHDVEQSTPGGVDYPHRGVEEYKMIPKKPGDDVHGHGEEHVFV